MRAAFFTLGCKVNQYDTDSMARLLAENGYEIVEFDEIADVYIINSCTVTGVGDKKSRQMVHRAREKNENAIICMAGCYPQVSKEEVEKLDVDLIIGTSNRSKIVELIEQSKEQRVVAVVDSGAEYEEMGSGQQNERTRAFLKIQDGCNSFCSYCIIPFARGRSRSRSREAILAETQKLIGNGFKEIVLTGIHLSDYGRDTGDSLLSLLAELDKMDGLFRIRLGSLDSPLLTQEFVDGLVNIKKLCPSFHVSLQSGSDATLERMNRKYTASEYRQAIDRLKAAFLDAAISTDIMVGFSGESEQDFLDSMNFVDSIGFAKVHIFPYSIRSGTAAQKYDGQISKAEKTARAKKMAEVVEKREKEYLLKYQGKIMDVLFEKELESGLFSGYTKNYIRVYAKGSLLHNEIRKCSLEELFEDGFLGEVEE